MADRTRRRMQRIVAAAFLCLVASLPVLAQPDDTPGYVAPAGAEELDPSLARQMVFFRTTEQPGTIIVHTSERFLYLVQANNRAIRYGIGVGRDGFQWAGIHK